ncbi:2-dehydro-3-deoxygluconokinase [Alphaproteobacteria bacterium SO-S41]|nr:2-dehydro-3-deoxygluconokinase [Alphaproteobacteria bacterium SO-S41]
MADGRIVCFGELLLRLTAPGHEVLLQTPRLDVHVGGAEANVAVSLARLGRPAAMVSVIPDTALGYAARDELRRHGVDTAGVRTGSGRMGLYFLSAGAVTRPSDVLYDRADSAFALAAPDLVDWEAALVGASWLHLSGVTPAIGRRAADAALRAAGEALRLGIPVSFDGNYRAKLWAAWDGDGPVIVRRLMESADLAFADDRDIALVLGERFDDPDPATRLRNAAAAAFDAFPNLKRIACTTRRQHAVGHHELAAVLLMRERDCTTDAVALSGIVDRIGGGDAFAAGLLFGLTGGLDDQASLDIALAAAALKHSIPGDFNLATEADIRAALQGGFDVRR